MKFGYPGHEFTLDDKIKYFCDFNTDFKSGKLEEASDEWYPLHFAIPNSENYLDENVNGWALNENNVTAKDSKLILCASDAEYIEYGGRESVYNGRYYMGSEVRSKTFYKYGYFEARMKINCTCGVCPAFWLLGRADHTKAESVYYEIDIFECFAPQNYQLQTSALKHVERFIEDEKGEFIFSKEAGRFVELRLDANKDITKDENGKILAKNDKYYTFNGKRYLCKHDTYNGFNTKQFSPQNWEYFTDEQNTYFSGFAGDGKYHTYALEWTDSYVMWIYDGIPVVKYNYKAVDASVGNHNEYICDKEMNIIFTCYSGRNVNGITGVPTKCDCQGDVCTKGPAIHTDWENNASLEVDYIVVREI